MSFVFEMLREIRQSVLWLVCDGVEEENVDVLLAIAARGSPRKNRDRALLKKKFGTLFEI